MRVSIKKLLYLTFIIKTNNNNNYNNNNNNNNNNNGDFIRNVNTPF